MKKVWEEKPLDEICIFKNGLWNGKKPPFKKIGVIRNTNFTKDCKLDYSDIAYLDVEVSQFESRKLEIGDIVLERSGGGPKQPVGRVVVFDKKEGLFSFSNFTSIIRVKNPTLVDYNFLHRVLYSFYISGQTEGMQNHTTGIRNLRFNEYKKIPIPLPPLPEQRRIVAILDEAFATIAKAKENAEKNLQNTRELFESYLNNVFTNPGDVMKQGWEIKTLGDFFDITSSKRVFKSEWKHEGIPFYRAREIVKLAKQSFVKNELFISEEMFAEYSTKYGTPKEGDIMITGVGTLGICYVVRPSDKFYFKDGNIIWLKKKSDVDSNFVEYAFRSDFLRKQIDNSVGVTVGTFTIIKAKNTHIPLPPLPEQKRIVAKLDELSTETQKLEAVYRQKQANLEELRQSLLRKAFEGEL